MAAGAWTFPNSARTDLLNGTFDIDSDTWKMALFLSTSNIGSGSTTYAGLTNEHANANGYTTGGIAVTLTLRGHLRGERASPLLLPTRLDTQ
jgi:hypothetical protein